jgi:hypothetical protein
MTKFSGLASLERPEHLLAKLRHDYERVRRAPSDTYAAFDFFVTAEHMIDWILPGQANKAAREELRASDILLQVVSHIAGGAKHFIAEAKHHQSVQHADSAPSAFQADAFQSDAFQTGGLFLTLEGAAATALGVHIGVPELAARVLRFWEKRLLGQAATTEEQ